MHAYTRVFISINYSYNENFNIRVTLNSILEWSHITVVFSSQRLIIIMPIFLVSAFLSYGWFIYHSYKLDMMRNKRRSATRSSLVYVLTSLDEFNGVGRRIETQEHKLKRWQMHHESRQDPP